VVCAHVQPTQVATVIMAVAGECERRTRCWWQ
jgi:hypothetical protein